MMRGINTTVRRLRRKVFEEVAALGFKADADTLCERIWKQSHMRW